MPSQTILCKDCAIKKQQIEETGGLRFVSCEPLQGEEDKPEDEQRCKFVWEVDI